MRIKSIKQLVVTICVLCTSFGFVSAQAYYPGGLSKSKINIWLDAADTSTITSPSGIFTWVDKANALQAKSPNASSNPVVNSTLLNGKKVIEFAGTKVLNIADNPLLDPTSGFNVAQVVYVHPDASTNYTTATDFRIGTYSRNESPGTTGYPTANIGTPGISVKYVAGANDSRYRLGLALNSSGGTLGGGNASFPDLAGNWHLFENYLTAPNSTDSATVIQLNAGSQISKPYSFYNSTQSLAIGNRLNFNASIHWSIGETILTGVPLKKTEKKILDVYLANKWHLQANIPVELQNLYNAPSASFINNLVGIGMEGGIDSVAATATNNGLGFINIQGITGFLRENGDYLLAADNAATGASAIGTGFTKWNRTWFIDKTDVVGYGGNVNILFDFSTYGIVSSLDTAANTYYLMFNSSDGTFASSNNYLIPVTSYQQYAGTKQVSFLVDASKIANGYYTIIYATKGTSTTTIPLITSFSSPTTTISPAPYLTSVTPGNTYNYLVFNTDSISYNVSQLKIYVGANGTTPVLFDSVPSSTKFYAHYNLTNGTTYQYYVKAVYSPSKESVASNLLSATPNLYSPQWQVAPQYASSGKVFMRATIVNAAMPLKFYFECSTSGGHSSGYQASYNYTDTSLDSGNSYTYRFKTMDSTKGISTESAWSASLSALMADSAKGGFAYKFSFIDNNSIIIPNGTGPSNYMPTNIDTTGLRFIKHAPAFGVHPRIYCNPEDSTDIKWRLKNTASGRAVAKYFHAYTTLLQLGYGVAGGYSSAANYAKDTLGNPLIGNLGYASKKTYYDLLAAGDNDPTYNYSNQWAGNGNAMAAVFSFEAFECWLFKGTIDVTTNTSYTVRAAKLAKAVTIWAQKALADVASLLSFDHREQFGTLQMAFIYDYLYDQMTPNQRDTVRMGLAAIALRDSSNLHLYNSPSYTQTSNWATFGFEIMPLLAIEGEAGYDSRNENALQNYCRTVLNFLNYGVYTKTGQPYEGIGKNQMNVPMLVALAKRGYSLLSHPSLKAYYKLYTPAIMQPFGYSWLGTDLLGGTGKLNMAGQYTSAAYGGWKPSETCDPIGFKWAFPKDTIVDYMWKNYMQKQSAGGTTYPYTYYYQDFLGDNLGHSGYWNFLYAAVFATDYSATPMQTQAQSIYGNGKYMYFDSLGGFATMRSNYDSLATVLFYHNRQDLGGHSYGNKNDIVFSSQGRIWIPRILTNANSNSPLSSGTGASSGILINGVGQSVDTSIDHSINNWPVPGKVVYYANNSNSLHIAGDAKDAYSLSMTNNFGGFTGDNPLLGGIYSKMTKSLNSYRYSKNYSFDDISLYDRLCQGDYSWAAGAHYIRAVIKPWLHGNVNKVFRTIAMVTDPKPYVVIADDVQRDNGINNYKWVAQLANDLMIDSVVVNNNNTNYRNDIIFKESPATGNRRFLVRVLNNTGAVDAAVPVYVDSITNPISSVSPNNKLPRIVVESNSIDPKYKIILFAYNLGDTLPTTTWNTDHTSLLVVNGAATNTILFPMDSAGRTNIQVLSGSILPVSITVAASIINNTKANISWKALEQQDVVNYALEKSIDAVSFKGIAIVNANGNITANYSFIDANPTPNINYYRIKITNKDGSTSYSKIVNVSFLKLAAIQIAPTPIIASKLTIIANNLILGRYTLNLYNVLGQSILQTQVNILSPMQTINLSLNNAVQKGTYRLVISGGDNNLTATVIRQ